MQTCRICNSSGNFDNYLLPELLYGTKIEYCYFTCNQCNTLQIESLPANIQELYPKTYHSFNVSENINRGSGISDYLRNIRDKNYFDRTGIFASYLNKFKPFKSSIESELLKCLQANTKESILDVGCGAGDLVEAMRRYGFLKAEGIDPFLPPADNSRQKPFYLRKYGFTEIDKKYDILIFNHVFEHIENPHEVLMHAGKILNDKGRILIRIPIFPSWIWDKYKEYSFVLQAPWHLYLYSVDAVKLLANKYGYDLYKVVFDADEAHIYASEQNMAGVSFFSEKSYKTNKTGSMFTEKQIDEYSRLVTDLNNKGLSDSAQFYLKKG